MSAAFRAYNICSISWRFCSLVTTCQVIVRNMQTQSSLIGKFQQAICCDIGKPLTVDVSHRKPLGPDEVRIKVHGAGINYADILLCQGKYQEKADTPFCPGSEFAGRVLETGNDVTGLKIGDKVVGMAVTRGAFAEEVVTISESVTKMPDVSYEKAAALQCSYGTAWLALDRKARIQHGESVLVTAAAGGVGLASVDMAANVYNCDVIAACGDSTKCMLARTRGATHTINYSTENIRDRVMEITNQRGVDVIVDVIGGKTFNDCLRSLAFEGRLVVVGFVSAPEIPLIPANRLLLKSCSAVGVFWGSYAARHPAVFKQSILSVMTLLHEGKINPLVCATFPLNKVNEAFQYIVERKSTGKVVIVPQTVGNL